MKKITGWSFFATTLLALVVIALLLARLFGIQSNTMAFIFVLSFIFTLQGIFTLTWMLYAWENPYKNARNKPSLNLTPKLSFTALLPARHEENVISQTIEAVDKISYPDYLKQILVICREDDIATIQKSAETMHKLGNPNIRLIVFSDNVINKPHALNFALPQSDGDIVCIFDAEDQPHSQIYNHINTAFQTTNADVIQSAVQLMNYKSHWFSLFNCLEYFFWFKSGLPFFHRIGNVTPLGGNTVFFKRSWLEAIGGWDEQCLTEDAEIAIRYAILGANFHISYLEELATQEETPNSTSQLIKQRTRWDQGFLQVFTKMDWALLPSLSSKLIIMYALISPFITLLTLIYLPFGLIIGFLANESLMIGLFSYLPLYVLFSQIVVNLFGLHEFSRLYKLKISPVYYLKLLILFFPYQLVISYSALRSVYKFILGVNLWEKTQHTNAHRATPSPAITT